MTDSTSPALRIALAYHQAWAAHDLDTAMTYVADDIVCDAPAGPIEGAAAYRAFMAPYVDNLLGTTVLAAFGDAGTAVLVYDSATRPVPSAPGAEYVTVRDGLIVQSRFIFDRLPFQLARQ